MAFTKYSKWIPSPLDGLSLEELLDQMSEFFLQSGFGEGFRQMGDPHMLEALRQAIVEKLVEMGRIPEDLYMQWLEDPSEGDAKKLDELVDQLIRQMIEEGWIRSQEQPNPSSMDQEGQGTE